MAWSVLTWKILRISQSRFLSEKVCAETRHSSDTTTLPVIIREFDVLNIINDNYQSIFTFLFL